MGRGNGKIFFGPKGSNLHTKMIFISAYISQETYSHRYQERVIFCDAFSLSGVHVIWDKNQVAVHELSVVTVTEVTGRSGAKEPGAAATCQGEDNRQKSFKSKFNFHFLPLPLALA